MDTKLLILDIDETLVHAVESPLGFLWDFETGFYFVYKRPHLDDFFDFCRQHFKVAIWTTGGEVFADCVVKNILTSDYPLEFVWSRERCTRIFDPELYQTGYLKNLQKVKRKGYCLEHVLMIDDTPSKLRKSYGNLIAIPEFTGNQNDKELVRLMKYLLELKEVENVRSIEKRGWTSKYEV